MSCVYLIQSSPVAPLANGAFDMLWSITSIHSLDGALAISVVEGLKPLVSPSQFA